MKSLFHTVENNILKILISFLIIFIPLYPKLPSIGISHTWVYIRLEDFFIAFTVLVWLIQLLRKKVKLNFTLGIPIFIYWFVGLCSLVFSLIFIGPHLANFFPKIAALSYLRRIEYMILFFVAMSTIKNSKDLKSYLVVLTITISGICLYGFGQRFYLYFWHLFPSFFEKYSFCFPSFQTGNEQFAKGIPLCLPSGARIPSTFAGQYDLGAYLVLVIPILITTFFAVKRFFIRIGLFVLSVSSMMLLIFTASRVSFVACLASLSVALVLYKKKRFIPLWIIIAFCLLMIFNGSTAKRLLETVRFTSIVTNSQGQVVGEAESSLPPSLRNKIAKNPVVVGNVPTQNLPKGSGFISLPQATSLVATNTAVVKTSISVTEAKKLKLSDGGVEISTISGAFLVHKALVYDISFTTRFQEEWPNALNAFLRNPPLGSGFSSITLATDNDYLRALGESGFLGLLSFLFIFLMFGILLKEGIGKVDSEINKAYLFGISGGMIGIFLNASLIDVFEASKLAETLWILLGLGVAIILLYNRDKIGYLVNLKNFFTSHVMLACYIFVIVLTVFASSINNFFVADDFTWLHWAASSTLHSIKLYFTSSQGFFYRPIDKTIMFFLYTFFSFQPQGYHLFIIFLHSIVGLGVYILGLKVFNRKLPAFLSSLIFLLLPSSGENIFWISTISITLSTLFILYALVFMIIHRLKGSVVAYFLAILLEMFALLSYEGALVFPLLLLSIDFILLRQKKPKRLVFSYIPFIILLPLYLGARFFAHAVWPSGNYGYNLLHLIPNTAGNLIGYFALFTVGEKALPFYTLARLMLKAHSLIILVILVLAIIICALLIFLNKKRINFLVEKEQFSVVAFCLLFSFIALLPFLGLGNISERYGYLSSVGFVFLAIYAIDAFIKKFVGKKGNVYYYSLFILVVIFWSLWNFSRLSLENTEWNHAGEITHRALSVFRVYYANMPRNSNIYIANVPIRKGNAWVFPVGLKDGLWFIYRNIPIHIHEVQSLKGLTASETTYLFKFDKAGNLLRVQ